MRRATVVWVAAVSAATLILGQAPGLALADSSGNAGIHLEKTVESTSLDPVLALTLQTDRSQAIPGDTITYSGAVTNTGARLGFSGRFTAAAHADTDANVVSYWDELQTCLTGCGNGVADPHWTALVAFVASQPKYVPVQPPAVSSGLSLTATPAPMTGVTYPASGDTILGTDIGPQAIAIWKYQASVTLTPAQIAFMSDPNQVQAVRNVIHFEVVPRNSQAAQPFDDDPQFANPLQSHAIAAAATNVVVTVTTPDGAKVQVTSSTVPGLASLAPGASVGYSTSFRVPAVGGKASGESDADYLKRLAGVEGSSLSATAGAAGTGFSGPVSASAGRVTSIEHLPIVGITKTGPGGATAGTSVTYRLALQNGGGAQASVTVNDALSDGGSGTVSGVPATLAPGASASAQASYAIPASSQGSLTDTASVAWTDTNGNAYGPVSSAFTTQVSQAKRPAVMPVALTPVQGNFFAEPATAGTFVARPGDTPAFSQSFPNIDFNPPSGVVPANSSGVGPQTRPFTDVTTDLAGNFAGTTVAQGAGVQAGVGGLTSFDAVFLYSCVLLSALCQAAASEAGPGTAAPGRGALLLSSSAAQEEHRPRAVVQHEAGRATHRARPRRLVPTVDARADHHERAAALVGEPGEHSAGLTLGRHRLSDRAQRPCRLVRLLQGGGSGLSLGVADHSKAVRRERPWRMQPAALTLELAAGAGVDDVREDELVATQREDSLELGQQLRRTALGDSDKDAHHRNVAAMVSVAARSSTGVITAPSFRY
jgi:hypothetical protein